MARVTVELVNGRWSVSFGANFEAANFRAPKAINPMGGIFVLRKVLELRSRRSLQMRSRNQIRDEGEKTAVDALFTPFAQALVAGDPWASPRAESKQILYRGEGASYQPAESELEAKSEISRACVKCGKLFSGPAEAIEAFARSTGLNRRIELAYAFFCSRACCAFFKLFFWRSRDLIPNLVQPPLFASSAVDRNRPVRRRRAAGVCVRAAPERVTLAPCSCDAKLSS